MILFKNRSQSDNWIVYHEALGNTNNMYLDATNATHDRADTFSDASPTSSVFTLGDASGVNNNTDSIIAYCFAPKQGFSAMGSYIGNGADTQFIYTGFTPAFLLVKGSSNTSHWTLWDNKRLTYNATYGRDRILFANLSNAEQDNSSDGGVDFLSNGFCWRGTASMTGTTEVNEGSAGYIYMAFAEAPFVNSNGVPCNAR